MPIKCSVSSCDNYYSKDVPFFDVPTPLKYKFSSEKADLSKKRRKLWLDAMGITNDSSNMLRICGKHFITGKPADLEDASDDDWIPTLCMKSRSLVRKKRKRRNSTPADKKYKIVRNSLSAKENALYKREQFGPKRGRGRPRKNKIVNKLIAKQCVLKKISDVYDKDMDTKINSKKVDLKTFLNCKVLLDGNIQCTTFKGTNGSGLTIAQRHDSFTSENVTVRETAINNTVLRIHLIREDLYDLKRQYQKFRTPRRQKGKARIVSSFGRQIKRRNSYFGEPFVHTSRLRSSIAKTEENLKSSVSEKSVRSLRNRIVEDKPLLMNKFNARNEIMQNTASDSPNTLNRMIRKHYRDKIKIKLFPKTTDIQRPVRNGTLISKSNKSIQQLDDEVLFVRRYKNDQQRPESNVTYTLKSTPYRCPEDGILNYSFQKLVTDVKLMKLPSPRWKIKVIIRQGKIAAITFTNKSTPERSVGFSANSNKYKITVDDRPALLLGSPESVQTAQDLEILLDIIENVDAENVMVCYK